MRDAVTDRDKASALHDGKNDTCVTLTSKPKHHRNFKIKIALPKYTDTSNITIFVGNDTCDSNLIFYAVNTKTNTNFIRTEYQECRKATKLVHLFGCDITFSCPTSASPTNVSLILVPENVDKTEYWTLCEIP